MTQTIIEMIAFGILDVLELVMALCELLVHQVYLVLSEAEAVISSVSPETDVFIFSVILFLATMLFSKLTVELTFFLFRAVRRMATVGIKGLKTVLAAELDLAIKAGEVTCKALKSIRAKIN